jgi:mycoredoxin
MGLFSKSRSEHGAEALDESVGESAVTIYTTSWCGSCMMAKRYLQQKGIGYREVDIDRVQGAAEIVMGHARGYKTVPTIVVGDSVVVDWDRRGRWTRR